MKITHLVLALVTIVLTGCKFSESSEGKRIIAAGKTAVRIIVPVVESASEKAASDALNRAIDDASR